MEPSTSAQAVPVERRCPICQTKVAAGEPVVECPECRTEHHADCWEENGGCAIYGCPRVPPTEARNALEIPMGYWGQERKPCPRCGESIAAAAIRCRQCGAAFESQRPVNRTEYEEQLEIRARSPAVRRQTWWLIVWAVIPLTAWIAALWGIPWYRKHRPDLLVLPAIYGALARIALGVAIGQCALFVVILAWYSIAHAAAVAAAACGGAS